jgi:hypothetical protein
VPIPNDPRVPDPKNPARHYYRTDDCPKSTVAAFNVGEGATLHLVTDNRGQASALRVFESAYVLATATTTRLASGPQSVLEDCHRRSAVAATQLRLKFL